MTFAAGLRVIDRTEAVRGFLVYGIESRFILFVLLSQSYFNTFIVEAAGSFRQRTL